MSQAISITLSQEEQKFLGLVARQGILRGWKEGLPPDVQSLSMPPFPQESAVFAELGAFVTLTKRDRLRGCIGYMIGHGPLYLTVAKMGFAAAFQDYRFPKLQPSEWSEIQFEISVLGPLSPCPNPDLIEIGRHGLMLTLGNQSGVFLPQVPVDQHWDMQTYLQELCRKAGLPPNSWLQNGAQLFWYEALVFTPPAD